MEEIIIKEEDKASASRLNKLVPEFFPTYIDKHFDDKVGNKESLILIAYSGGEPAGFTVWYDRDSDGSFYCWMAGVVPEFRKQGLLKKMMDYGFGWAKDKGYKKIKIKTRNMRREMLAYLVKNDFMFTRVVEWDEPLENRIELEKDLK